MIEQSLFVALSGSDFYQRGRHAYLTLAIPSLFDVRRAVQTARRWRVPFEVGYSVGGAGRSRHYHRWFVDCIYFPAERGRINVWNGHVWRNARPRFFVARPGTPFAILGNEPFFFLKFIARRLRVSRNGILGEKVYLRPNDAKTVGGGVGFSTFAATGRIAMKEGLFDWRSDRLLKMEIVGARASQKWSDSIQRGWLVVLGGRGCRLETGGQIVRGPFLAVSCDSREVKGQGRCVFGRVLA